MDKTSAIDMEYNNYYPSQAGHHPPPVANQQHGGSQLQQPPQPPPGGQILHAPMSNQNIRQAMPPGPPSHHQQQLQQQHQQHISHHQQQMPPQQQPQPHPNYHHIQPPHSHGPPVSHSGSPHTQQQQQHHNHQQPNLTGPQAQQTAIPSQQHHMHSQSPHHHAGPPMHMQHQQQPLNQMIRQPLGPSVINHPQQPGLPQPPHHQNFFASGPIPQSNLHHYLPHQNQHHPHHQPQHHHHQQHHHHHHQQPLMHHAQALTSHHPHIQQGIGRNSPIYPSILQTEFRIIELNRRLQCRPISRHPVSPLPSNPYDEIFIWWEKFASEFFEDDATLTMRIPEDDKISEYTIGRTLIPRFFRTYFDGGVTDLSINLRNPRESCLHPHLITLNCDQAFIITNNIYRYPLAVNHQSVVVHTEGQLILDFVSNSLDTLSIKSWKFYTRGSREYIDRSMTAMALPTNHFLADPVTKQGLTKSTISYLKMCMIMEPMQDLMFQHIQTKMDPRSCLRKLLFDKYKYSSGEDNRVATNKRNRKRKSSAAPATGPTSKKPKANVNNPAGNNSGLNNNMMSPSGPGFSLASQDVMVVGEPSMMGGDFGDDNERMITRLENTQYDPAASTPSNMEESDSMNASTGNDNGISNSNNIEATNIENHTMSPSLLQQRQQQSQQQVPPLQVMSQQQSQVELSSPQGVEAQQQHLHLNIQEQNPEESASGPINQVSMIEHNEMEQQDQQKHLQHHQQQQQQLEAVGQSHLSTGEQVQIKSERVDEEPMGEDHHNSQHDTVDDVKINSVLEAANDSNLMTGVNTVCGDEIENHKNSIQPLNEESNSNSQLPCSTASATSAIEQQQPVDNGVA